jgi:tripartite motif-containing protein 71
MGVLDPGKMYRPTDIAVDVANDVVYVVEQFNHRISKWDYTPDSFDFTLDTGFGTNGVAGTPGGAGNGGPSDTNLQYPTNIILNSAGNLLISDTRNHRIRVMDSDGNFIESFGTAGQATTGGEFYRPSGIDADNTDDILMIADEFNNRCQAYSSVSPYTFIGISEQPTGLHNLSRPSGVTYDSTNDVFLVSEKLGNHVNEYEDDGVTFTAQFGSAGTDNSDAQNSLYRPTGGHGIIEPNTLSPLADSFRNRIKEVDSSSDTITHFIGQVGTDATATVTIAAGATSSYAVTNGGTGYVTPPTVLLPSEAGAGTGATSDVTVSGGAVTAIAVDTAGSGFTNGTFDVSFNLGAGTQEGDMYQPNSAIGFVDTANYTLVANTKNNRIEVYEENQYRASFGSPFV